ncbi:MAG: YkgJ family cysteine cluster protein [Lachnospiraceae bacterium]|nr:YkgJ family cysteine cluster protein [Lachnospiraceae bacterium]
MKRDVDIDEISDGCRYRSGDMVKIGCAECKGCSECCRQVDDTIILDPYDIYQLCKGLDSSFDKLMSEEPEPSIELGHADGLLLPHLKLSKASGGCTFLSNEGRCTIHSFRPGFCRLYPLGRIYEDGSFSYFIQIHECPYPNKSKVKIKKWLGIDNLPAYEAFILKWHDILDDARSNLSGINDQSERSRYIVAFLKRFYQTPYDTEVDFYTQFEERFNS